MSKILSFKREFFLIIDNIFKAIFGREKRERKRGKREEK